MASKRIRDLARTVTPTPTGMRYDLSVYIYEDGRGVITGPDDTLTRARDSYDLVSEFMFLVRHGQREAQKRQRQTDAELVSPLTIG